MAANNDTMYDISVFRFLVVEPCSCVGVGSVVDRHCGTVRTGGQPPTEPRFMARDKGCVCTAIVTVPQPCSAPALTFGQGREIGQCDQTARPGSHARNRRR